MPILRHRARYYLWRLSSRGELPCWEVRDNETGRRVPGTRRYHSLTAERSAKAKMDKLNADWDRYLVLRRPTAPHSLLLRAG